MAWLVHSDCTHKIPTMVRPAQNIWAQTTPAHQHEHDQSCSMTKVCQTCTVYDFTSTLVEYYKCYIKKQQNEVFIILTALFFGASLFPDSKR